MADDPNDDGLYEFYHSETTGFEVQLQGSLTDNWFISAGYASLDAEDPDGDRVREAPENMLSVWNNYTVTDRFAVNLGVVYQDDSQIGSGTTPILPAYTRVDVGATMLVTDNTTIQLNVENVTDELYFPHSHSTHQASVGAPVHATFGITSSF